MDKKALLNELKIERDEAPKQRRPLVWFVAIALLGGVAYVAWAFGVPFLSSPVVEVRTALVRSATAPAPGTSVLDATGYVVARRQATVSSKTTGKVLEVLIEEGMTVADGQLLARLDDSLPRAYVDLFESQLEAAKASINEIRVNIRQAELNLERTSNLAARELASKANLDRDTLALQALAARYQRATRDIAVAERNLAVQRRQLEDMEIRAPFGGVVIAKAAQPGEMISPVSAGGGFTRTGICTIVDMESLEVEVDVNEAYINRVYPKQPAKVTLNAYPDLAIAAEVIATIPAADRNKATVRVRIGFLQRDPRVLPDMGAKVAFLEDEEVPAEPTAVVAGVLVPSAAVQEEAGERYVWVVANAVAERRSVQVDKAEGGRIRVTHGLTSGERVVASLDSATGSNLRDGTPVTVVN